jgi:hypothetical protein
MRGSGMRGWANLESLVRVLVEQKRVGARCHITVRRIHTLWRIADGSVITKPIEAASVTSRNRADSMWSQFERSGLLPDLDEAIAVEVAVLIPREHRDRAAVLAKHSASPPSTTRPRFPPCRHGRRRRHLPRRLPACRPLQRRRALLHRESSTVELHATDSAMRGTTDAVQVGRIPHADRRHPISGMRVHRPHIPTLHTGHHLLERLGELRPAPQAAWLSGPNAVLLMVIREPPRWEAVRSGPTPLDAFGPEQARDRLVD